MEKVMITIMAVLTGLTIVLQIPDVLTTNRILSRGGIELNPMIRFAMRKFGRWWWITKFPTVALLLFIFGLAYFHLITAQLGVVIMGAVLAVYVLAVTNNVRVMLNG